MRTLIIPCSNTAILDGTHRLLARHPDGKSLCMHCILDFDVSLFDRIIISISEKDDRSFNIANHLYLEAKQYGVSLEICKISEETFGPADAVYKTCAKMNVSGSIVIKDSHTSSKFVFPTTDNFIVGLNVFKCANDINNLKSKSFIVTNENNLVLDIIEKSLKSDTIGVGVYGIEDVMDFYTAFSSLNKSEYEFDKIYMSHIISYLIGAKKANFYLVDAIAFDSFATQYEWNLFKNRCSSYFVNASILFDSNGHLITKSLEQIRRAIENGAEILLYSSSESSLKTCSKILKEHGVEITNSICLKNNSKKVVIDSEVELNELA